MSGHATRHRDGNPPASPWGSSRVRLGAAGLLGAAAILFFHPGAMDWDRVKWSLLFAAGLPILAIALRSGLVLSVRARLSPPLLAAALVPFLVVFSSFRTGPSSAEELRLVAGLLLLLVVAVVVRDGAWARPWTLPLILLSAGAAAAACALLQSAGVALFGLDNPGNEAVGTLGNTNAAAEVFALLLPAAAAGVLSSRRGIRAVAVPALALLAAGLVATGGRAGLLAALAGLGALAGLCFFTTPGRPGNAGANRSGGRLPRWKRAILPGALLVAGAAGAILTGSGPGTPFKNIESDESVFSAAYPTNRIRLLIWESTCDMIGDHPIMGAGPGRFATAFPPYRDPYEARIRGRMGAVTAVENPHNEFLWAAAEGGIGAAAALALFLLLLLARSRAATMMAPDRERALHAAGLGGIVAAFIVLSLFRAPLHNPAAAIILFAAAGMLEATRSDAEPGARAGLGALLVKLGGGAAVIVVAFLGMQALRSDLLFAGVGLAPQLDREEYARLERAIEIDPGNIELANFLGQVAAGVAARIDEAGGADRDYRAAAERWLLHVLRRNPHHPGALATLARIRLLQGNRSAGRHLLARALAAAGSEEDPALAAADLLAERKLHAHAAAFLSTARKDGDTLLLDRGNSLLETGEARAAALYADEQLKTRPLDVDALQLKARAIRELGTGGEDHTFRMMQIAISLDWFDGGDWVRAGRSADRALRYGDDPAARLLAAAAAAAQGEAFEPPEAGPIGNDAIRERLKRIARDARLPKEVRALLKDAARTP